MSDPSSTPGVPSDLLDRLGAELAEIGRRVERVRGDLGALRTVAASGPDPAPAADVPAPGRRIPRWEVPAAPGGLWAASGPAAPSIGASAGPPAPPAPSAPPARSAPPRPGGAATRTARLLAVAGGVVTLLGVVLLLVLAASRGWFGPEARVVAGAVVGAVLVAAGVRTRSRASGSEGSDTGAVALAGTGFAALFLTVAAATSLYDLVPVPVGLVLALGVVGGGLVLADRWRHRDLALGVLLGGDLLAPLVVGAPTPVLVALLLVAQVAALPVALRRDWPVLAVGAAAASALGALAAVVRHALLEPGPAAIVTVTTLVLLLGVVTAVATGVVPVADAAAGRSGGPAPGARAAACVAGPLVPLLVLVPLLPRAGGAVLAAVGAVVLVALAALLGRGALPAAVRPGRTVAVALALVLAAAGSVLALEATVVALRGAAQGGALLAEALVLAVAAAAARRRWLLVLAGGFGVVGILVALVRDLPAALLTEAPPAGGPRVDAGSPHAAGELLGAAAVALLVLAVAVALLVAAHRVGLLRDGDRTAVAGAVLGLAGLYGATGLLVTLALLISPTRTGFLAGHALVTVSWTALALVLLMHGVRSALLRVLGGVLVVAALGKLVLFDLTELDGLARVTAFLGAGVVLLVAGSRYARLVADSADSADSGDGADRADGPPPAT